MNSDEHIYRASGKSPGGAGVRSSYRLIFQRCSQAAGLARFKTLLHSSTSFTLTTAFLTKLCSDSYMFSFLHICSVKLGAGYYDGSASRGRNVPTHKIDPG